MLAVSRILVIPGVSGAAEHIGRPVGREPTPEAERERPFSDLTRI